MKKTGKLRLTPETLRILNDDRLRHVAGGKVDLSGGTCECPASTHCDTDTNSRLCPIDP